MLKELNLTMLGTKSPKVHIGTLYEFRLSPQVDVRQLDYPIPGI